MTSLPDELIAAVVDELEHDRESLKACSLVGASFCAPSQRRLFHSMWLHHDAWWFSSRSYTPSYSGERGTPGSTIRTLAPVLSESPHLATYVRRLTIDLTTFPEEAALLAQMLRAMQNLKTFAVSSSFLNWNDLPLALTSACLDVLELPSLDRLHLWCIENIPASVILGALSSTTVLSIFSSTIATQLELPTSAAEPVPENTSRLHKLLLTSSESSSYDLILSPRAPELTQMTTLLLRPHIATKLGAERLLSSLSGTLTHLILDSERAPLLLDIILPD
ncbi:hypothetical protein B0H19DRAFT_1123960 [Mycena capillaripes]|nr:hypothetical protein B0H19DRAFT_1123960 [Mycena capillaripes]